MSTGRFFFLIGVALAALVLFGPETASAQVATAPSNVSAVALDHQSIRVRWEWTDVGVNDDGHDGFEIRYQMGDEIDAAEQFMYDEAGESATSLIVDDLDHGEDYVFQVRAVGRNAEDTADATSDLGARLELANGHDR